MPAKLAREYGVTEATIGSWFNGGVWKGSRAGERHLGRKEKPKHCTKKRSVGDEGCPSTQKEVDSSSTVAAAPTNVGCKLFAKTSDDDGEDRGPLNTVIAEDSSATGASEVIKFKPFAKPTKGDGVSEDHGGDDENSDNDASNDSAPWVGCIQIGI